MYLFNDQIMYALCWTLIHSLWQGLLTALGGGVVILITRRSSAAIRYNLLSLLFLIFVGVACVTFVREYRLQTTLLPVPSMNPTLAIAAVEPIYQVSHATSPVSRNGLEIINIYLNNHAQIVVSIWFMMMVAQCLRLITNAIYIQRLRRLRIFAPSVSWQRRLRELARTLGMKKSVLFFESGIVKAPLVVGFFKPVILFPLSMMTQLPAEQVEAVLLHELAHIRRKDYLVNLVQNLAEVIFFFNPGVLWISAAIRDERENCCDDMAVTGRGNREEFVNALVSFQEYYMRGSGIALGFPGRKNRLLDRATRILTNNNKTLNNMEKISLATGIVVAALSISAFTSIPHATHRLDSSDIKTSEPSKIIRQQFDRDTVPPSKAERPHLKYIASIDGKDYRLEMVDGKVISLTIDGEQIPSDKIGDYSEIIEKLQVLAKADQDKQAVEVRAWQEYLEHKNLDNKAIQRLEIERKLNAEMLDRQRELLNRGQSDSNADSVAILAKRQAELDAEAKTIWEKSALDHLELEQKDRMVEQSQLAKEDAELKAMELKSKIQEQILTEEIRSLSDKDAGPQLNLLKMRLADLQAARTGIDIQQQRVNNLIMEHSGKGGVSDQAELLRPKSALSTEASESSQLITKPIEAIIFELFDEKVINSKDNLTIVLNKDELKVNGIRQPEEMHARFMERYLNGNKGNHVRYSKHGASVTAEISIND